MAKRVLMALSIAPLAVGCGPSQSEDLPVDPPTSVTKVTSGGFLAPTDAVASPDGKTFYFAAYTEDTREAAIFKTASEPGSTAEVLAVGAPLASPMGLVLSCDGGTMFVADLAASTETVEAGGVFALSTSGGAVGDLRATGVVRPAGLAMAPDCNTLHVTGRTEDGLPGLFTLATSGGAATALYSGDPLVSPTGLHVDDDGVSWVMDHLAAGTTGEGVLWAIPADGGAATEVASNLQMGTPGGVSLTAGGGTAVMPTRDADGKAQLTSISIATGEASQLAVPDLADPAGLRTARGAGVFAVVDSEGGAIFRAE